MAVTMTATEVLTIISSLLLARQRVGRGHGPVSMVALVPVTPHNLPPKRAMAKTTTVTEKSTSVVLAKTVILVLVVKTLGSAQKARKCARVALGLLFVREKDDQLVNSVMAKTTIVTVSSMKIFVVLVPTLVVVAWKHVRVASGRDAPHLHPKRKRVTAKTMIVMVLSMKGAVARWDKRDPAGPIQVLASKASRYV
jgi:hypothetical protein